MDLAVYARRSRKEELKPGEHETSTEQQIRECLKFAADHGWTVPDHHIYQEAGLSAYLRGVKRGRFDDMVAALERREVAGVVVWKLDRATRNTRDTARLTDLLDDGAIIASVSEGIVDASSPMGSVHIEMQGTFDKMVSRAISINARRGKAALARTGKPAMGGRRRFGFEDDQQTHRTDEVALLRDAAEVIKAGASYSSIVKRWNRDGVRMPGGSPWSVTPLRRVLTNPRVAGLRQQRSCYRKIDDEHRRHCVEWLCQDRHPDRDHCTRIVGAASWEPILDRATWEWLCRHFATADQRKGGRPTSYLLTGYVWCADCQWRLFGRWKDGRRIYTGQAARGCQHVVSADPIEELVADRALELLDTPQVTAAIIGAKSDDSRVAALHDEHDALVQRQHDLAGQAANPGIPLSVVAEAAQTVDRRLAVVKEELARVLPRKRALALRWADTPSWSWHHGDPADHGDELALVTHRRGLLGLVVKRVEVRPVGRTTAGRFDSGRVHIVPVPELESNATVRRIVARVLRRS